MGFTNFYVLFVYFQFLKDYHSISAKKRDWNSNEKWNFLHLSTFFVYRVSGAYCGFMVLILLSKIEEIDTLKATNLHKNAIKTYSKLSQISQIKLDRSETVKKTSKLKILFWISVGWKTTVRGNLIA
jgi:hypothetical protein